MGNLFTLISLLVIVFCIIVSSWVIWRVLDWLWWKPRKLEKLLREQGFKGSPRKFFYGDLKEIQSFNKRAQAKPMELTHRIVWRVIPFIAQIVERYGPLPFYWIGVTPCVIILDPELIRGILSNKFGKTSKRKLDPLSKLLTEGLANHNGEKWAKHKKIINPAFHLEKLKLLASTVCDCCTVLVNKWEKLVADGSRELDVWLELQNLTKDVICRAEFGSSYKEGHRIFELQAEQIEYTIKAPQSIYIPGISWYMPTRRNKRMKELDREITNILTDMINERESATRDGMPPKNDLLGLLLDSNFKYIKEQGNTKDIGMSINEIIDECKLFFIAGQESTGNLLVWTMVLLSMHQEWQAHAREEVLHVFGGNKPDFNGLNHLKIVTMILNEVLRLYSSETMLMRFIDKEMKLGSITLPAGVQINLPIILVHHNYELWGEDAEEFNPERFSKGVLKATTNQEATFFPFGWGPRICIGQSFALLQAKMALATILQRFSFELSPTYVHAPNISIAIQPQYGAQVILHKL